MAITACLIGLVLPGCDTLVTEVNEYTIAGHPTAEFGLDSNSVDSGCVPLTVAFIDKSRGPHDTWIWNFGDGTADTASIKSDSTDTISINPIHVYQEAGTYTVSLSIIDSTVDDEPGGDIEVKNRFIIVGTTIGSFSAAPDSGCPGMEVTFSPIDYGGITGWSWNFGDGSPGSSDSNPTHPYDTAGEYSCTLTVTGECGTKVIGYDSLIKITQCPVAHIWADKFEGCVPCTVVFDDSTDYGGEVDTLVNWDFGNEVTSELRSDTVVYAEPGKYTVKLTAYSEGGVDTDSIPDFITVLGPPETEITALTPFEGCLSGEFQFQVRFQALLTNFVDSAMYDSLIWFFGDGTRSDTADPMPLDVIHAYGTNGQYTVTLQSYGPCYFNGDSAMENVAVDYVCVSWPIDPTVVAFTVDPSTDTIFDPATQLTFTDMTPGFKTGWKWSLGDNNERLDSTFVYIYADTGTYIVTLTVSTCCDSYTITDTIIIAEVPAGTARKEDDNPSAEN